MNTRPCLRPFPPSSQPETPSEPEPRSVPDLLCKLNDQQVFVQPLRPCGLSLWCQVPATKHSLAQQLLVFNYWAVDQSAYWAAWRAVGGDRQGLCYEDGWPLGVPRPPAGEPPAQPTAGSPQIKASVKLPGRWGRVALAFRGLWRALLDALFPPWTPGDDGGY